MGNSGHSTLEQRQNFVEMRLLRCSKLNYNIISTSSACWDNTGSKTAEMPGSQSLAVYLLHK